MSAKKKTATKKATRKRAPKKPAFENVPPLVNSFNSEHGLREGVNYIFKEPVSEGGLAFVDWRKMIGDEHIFLNREKFLNKSTPVDVDQLSKEDLETLKKKAKDEDLIIKLQGYKELAQLRGYSEVKYDIVTATPDFVSVNCSISWLPNYETGCEVIEDGAADAHAGNCSAQFGANYLTAIASNRAFGRAVRNFLKIDIVTQDEIAFEKPEEMETVSNVGPASMIADILKKKGVEFSTFKEKLEASEYNYVGVEAWKSPQDIPSQYLTLVMTEARKLG